MSELVSKQFEAEMPKKPALQKENALIKTKDRMVSTSDSSTINKDESAPQAESAVGRVKQAVPAWDYKKFPDGRLPYA